MYKKETNSTFQTSCCGLIGRAHDSHPRDPGLYSDWNVLSNSAVSSVIIVCFPLFFCQWFG